MELEKGKCYVLMGPNGSGKSSLAKVISGDPSYKILDGEILLNNGSLLDKTPEERTKKGVFISYQHPPEIPGLKISEYMRQIYNKKHEKTLSPAEFSKLLDQKLQLLNFSTNFKNRHLNTGFSGGEKKKMEILQMLLLDPEVAVLDEIDSGVDVDALKIITTAIEETTDKQNLTTLFITHYPSLLEYINPSKIFLMKEGKIVEKGQQKLAEKIQEKGYAEF